MPLMYHTADQSPKSAKPQKSYLLLRSNDILGPTYYKSAKKLCDNLFWDLGRQYHYLPHILPLTSSMARKLLTIPTNFLCLLTSF